MKQAADFRKPAKWLHRWQTVAGRERHDLLAMHPVKMHPRKGIRMHPRKGIRQHHDPASWLACEGIEGILDIEIALWTATALA
jgi:hypothetical protein